MDAPQLASSFEATINKFDKNFSAYLLDLLARLSIYSTSDCEQGMASVISRWVGSSPPTPLPVMVPTPLTAGPGLPRSPAPLLSHLHPCLPHRLDFNGFYTERLERLSAERSQTATPQVAIPRGPPAPAPRVAVAAQ